MGIIFYNYSTLAWGKEFSLEFKPFANDKFAKFKFHVLLDFYKSYAMIAHISEIDCNESGWEVKIMVWFHRAGYIVASLC
mgnify:CR=1 FL=1